MIQNQYPLWRYLLVLAITVLGALYALPNLYGFDPALQISARRSAPVDSALQKTLTEAVSKAGAELKASEVSGGRLLLRFKDDGSRSKAMTALREVVDTKQYLVAFNLASATPDWLRSLGGKPMYMGLDLRGGVHFLMQVDVEEVRKQIEDRFITELRAAFREKKVRFRAVSRAAGGGIDVTFLNAEAKKAAIDVINNDFRDLLLAEGPVSDEFPLKLTPKPAFVVEARKTAVKQNLTTLRNRINEFGVAEPVIQQQGDSRVVVQLPGVEDTAEAKKLIGATATLEFRMVDMAGDVKAATEGKVPPGSKLFQRRNDGPILLNRKVMLTGDAIVDASSGVEQQSGEPAVFITLDGKGARNFARSTREEIGKQMAVVFIEQVEGRRVEEVINVATIRDELGKRFQISGLDNADESRELALLLRAGALAAPMEIIEERTVGPSLGQANIDSGFSSFVVGFIAVCIYMTVYYRVFGLIANIGLAVNVVLLVALLSMLQATLSLPGIAGILLTVGVAVDANVLINERIREEIRRGMSPQAAIHAGYERAFATILDSNVTTLIAAIVLFSFGSGPVKGFAISLSLGILTSMFTAVTCTRALVNLIFGRRRLKSLSV
ncbi:MAG: protein translocase subunit SecD [Gammaproteobacteria bacterium]|nr:protein translocase subunit SecD [Gammaproteobacteria bacterium]